MKKKGWDNNTYGFCEKDIEVVEHILFQYEWLS